MMTENRKFEKKQNKSSLSYKTKKNEKPRLTYEEIEWIKALLTITPSISEVARRSRRSRDTITRIKQLNKNEIDSYRQLKKREFIQKAWEKIWTLIDGLTPEKISEAKVNQIAVAIGIFFDKTLLVESVIDGGNVDAPVTIRDLLLKCRKDKLKDQPTTFIHKIVKNYGKK